jgi:FKBP-type peptidyl-prolyl cis-trans isomerase SlpA
MSEVEKTVQRGARVRLHFTLALADGTVADSSEGDAPLSFTVGDGTLYPTLEAHLLGLRPGDRFDRRLAPAEGFGERDPANVHRLPRADFPAEMSPTPGQVVEFATPGGAEVAGTVLEVDDEGVSVDFNHPLSGRALRFTGRILTVDPRRDSD